MASEIAIPESGGGAVAQRSSRTRSLSPYLIDGNYADSGQFELGNLLRIVREWRWLILGAIALGLAGAVVVTLLTTPLYRAPVILEVNPPTVEILDEANGVSANAPDTWTFLDTQIGLLASRTLAERVAQDLNLAANADFVEAEDADATRRLKLATDKVKTNLNVEPRADGQLIRFSYVSESPELAAQIANGFAENFISLGLQRRFEASTYARTFLQQQIAKTRRDLERSERSLVAYAQAQGIIDTSRDEGPTRGSDASSLQGESLIALNSALADATARRVQAEGAYRQSRLAGVSAEVNQNTQPLRQAKAALEAEYQEKRVLMKPDHPEMLSLRSRIDELQRQISRETAQVASGRQNSLLAEYRGALAAERALQARVAQLKGTVLDMRGRGIQYNILQREVDTNRALYDALLQRYKEIGVAGGVGTTPVSIVDRAEVPSSPYRPNLLLNLLLGLGLGLVGGLVAALALEIINDTIKTREDVRNKLGLPCLGGVPKRRGKGSLVEDLSDLASPVTEAYSAILAALRFSTGSGAPKMLLVSSSRPAEGKSSTAFALAQNYARGGARVLLIDADLRRPAFKTADREQGLSRLLTEEGSVEQHLLTTQQENLWLLPAGPVPPNPADLLSTPRIKLIFAEAAAQFDHVIVDGPPALGLADATLLAAAARNVMLVVESGKTRTRAAREAVERMQEAGANILGVTLTKTAEESAYGYAYGYKLYNYNSKVGGKRSHIMITQQNDAS